ncbi:MAG: HPr family phosphocarrier protein [Firmicutes bacterium]|nr:HPr family phosphocarrier protein [Bacillota bacterium]
MRQTTVTITHPEGLHARPAAEFVRAAAGFACSVRLRLGDREVDGKSILEVLSLGAREGTTLTLLCDGPDSEAALTKLRGLLIGRQSG